MRNDQQIFLPNIILMTNKINPKNTGMNESWMIGGSAHRGFEIQQRARDWLVHRKEVLKWRMCAWAERSPHNSLVIR